MKRSMYVNVGFRPDTLRSPFFDKDKVLAEADAFRYAVGCMLNTVVAPNDFSVVITPTSSGFHVEIGTAVGTDDAHFASNMFKHDKHVKNETDAKQKLWDLLGSYLQHVDDMVNTYGVYFGDNLMLSVN